MLAMEHDRELPAREDEIGTVRDTSIECDSLAEETNRAFMFILIICDDG